MTNREKELRTKIGAECLHKGWKSDYLTSCSDRYNFEKCPDEFEYLKNELNDFYVSCDRLIKDQTFSCNDCWKYFLNEGKQE